MSQMLFTKLARQISTAPDNVPREQTKRHKRRHKTNIVWEFVPPCRNTRFAWKFLPSRDLTPSRRLQPLSLLGRLTRTSTAVMAVGRTPAFRVEAMEFVNTKGSERLAGCAKAPPSAPTTKINRSADCAARRISVSTTASGINASSARPRPRSRLLCPAPQRRRRIRS